MTGLAVLSVFVPLRLMHFIICTISDQPGNYLVLKRTKKTMNKFSITEFKPTIFFLVKFIGIYVVTNLLYGIFVTAYNPKPDPVTRMVSEHTSGALQVLGWQTETRDDINKPTTQLICDGKSVLAIFEGCNGINVMIIFVAFLIAFGPLNRALLWFIPVGLIILHVMNLVRIGLLFYVSLFIPRFMYFTHKYLFTDVLYVVVFLLWVAWVKKFTKPKPAPTR